MILFDAHVLIGQDYWLGNNKPELAHTLDVEDACSVLSIAADGSQWRAAAMPFPSAREPNYVYENNYVIDSSSKDNRLIPIAVANPKNAENFAYLQSKAAAGLLGGLMIWPILCDLDLRELADDVTFWSFVEQYDLPVTLHVATGDEPNYRNTVACNHYGPLDAVRLAARWPDVRFNLSHALRLSRPALEEVAKLRNVWTDLSGYSSFGRWREARKETFPSHEPIIGPGYHNKLLDVLHRDYGLEGRILFGSSEPFCRWWGFSAKREYAIYKQMPIAEKMKMEFVNAAELFYRNWPIISQRPQ
ncbi:amidohydrolase family protein [Lentilitoribacter sp. EG35]|uniref:amidohydrolase family protein n=1 Tax=Lentilitoribacter sp. EG35 TaxID=3234192 RepID=UPI0034613AAE